MSYIRYEASNAKIREDVMPKVAHCYLVLDKIKRSVYYGDLKKAMMQLNKHIESLEHVKEDMRHTYKRNNSLKMRRLSKKSKRIKRELISKVRVGYLLLRKLKHTNNKTYDKPIS